MQKIDETFQDDINSVWTKKLLDEFYFINAKVNTAIHRSLENPNFSFNYDSNHWGTWNPSTRTIMISYNLLRNYEWDAVVHTLKHEVAHMIVSEIWGDISNNGQSHGELFSKACKILNIDDLSKHSSIIKGDYQIPEKEKILSRIYKLFCLGESNYKEEAEAAITKAHELMIKYNISIKELPSERRSFISRPVGYVFSKVPEYIKNLARIICRYYSVKHIYIRRERGHYIEMYGEPHCLDVAEYIFHFLIHEGERQWKEFQKTEEYLKRFDANVMRLSYDRKSNNYKDRRKGKYNKVAFICGVYYGFEEILQKRYEDIKKEIDLNNTMPVEIKDALLDEKYKNHYHPCSWHSGGGSSGGGFSEGTSAGKNIIIHQGVTKGNNSTRLALNG